MNKDEALKMCLEYIETDAHERKYVRHAIKQALAAPVQEMHRYSPDGEGGMEVDSLGAYVKLQDVTTPPAAAPVQPVVWFDLLKQAEEVVRSKPLWKKYIDGTPLANDIAVWMASFAQEHTTPPAQPAPVQERTDYAVHLNHCNIGECEGVCKYGDDDCPALEHADMKAKWDRPTPPAAQQEHEPENEPYVSLASVQEPVAWAVVGEGEWGEWVIGQQFETNNPPNHEYWKNRGYLLVPLYATPPAQPAVPDAIGPNEDELPAYAAGWNDCRQAMLEMMK
jgi:hypothetical protein